MDRQRAANFGLSSAAKRGPKLVSSRLQISATSVHISHSGCQLVELFDRCQRKTGNQNFILKRYNVFAG